MVGVSIVSSDGTDVLLSTNLVLDLRLIESNDLYRVKVLSRKIEEEKIKDYGLRLLSLFPFIYQTLLILVRILS